MVEKDSSMTKKGKARANLPTLNVGRLTISKNTTIFPKGVGEEPSDRK